MRRVGAVLAAVAMIAVSSAVRARIDDGGDGSDDGRPARLLCATELEAACLTLAEDEDIDITVQPAAQSAAELQALPDSQLGTVAFDAWLAPAPLAEIVRQARERGGLAPVLDEPTERVARSPLVLAVRAERRGVLAEACGGEIGWRCLGDRAGTPWDELPGGDPRWGVVRAGHADPTVSGVGLLVLGQATSEYFGTTDLATIDLDTDPGFAGWLARLEGAGVTPPFVELLATEMASFDAAGTTEAEAGPLLAAAAPDRREAIDLLYLEPVVTADVVLAAVTGRAGGGDLANLVTGDAAARALAAAGWRVPAQERVTGVRAEPALHPTPGLPSPGLLQALQQRWREAVS